MAVEGFNWKPGEPYDAGYEQFVGTAQVALDPNRPANGRIVDLDRARRDSDGLVRFETDVVLLRAPSPGPLPIQTKAPGRYSRYQAKSSPVIAGAMSRRSGSPAWSTAAAATSRSAGAFCVTGLPRCIPLLFL